MRSLEASRGFHHRKHIRVQGLTPKMHAACQIRDIRRFFRKIFQGPLAQGLWISCKGASVATQQGKSPLKFHH
jgi:hypothetical protein